MTYDKKTLNNGLRVITVSVPTSLSTTVLVLVEAGSKYETKEINGLSHFLEHMCFKGTLKRPTAFHIAAQLDSLGAEYNAFTGREYTGYFAKAENRHLETALDVVSDLYLNPVFRPEEIEKERGVIIEEINMYEDLPMRKVEELFISLLYGDQPAGWDIAGTKEVIRKLNQEEFVNYRNRHYLAQSTVVVVAGNLAKDSLAQKIEDCFSGIKVGPKDGKVKILESQTGPQLLLRTKKSDQTHIILGARAYDTFNPKKYALQVLADILGGGMSSRLFQSVREKLGVVYYLNAKPDIYTDHGYLGVSAGIDHHKIESVIGAILDEFRRLKAEMVSDEELQRAKDHLTGGFVLGLEGTDALASFYGGQEILEKEMLTPEEVAQKIQVVSASEIQDAANEIFTNDKLNLAIISPLEDKAQLENILKL